MLSCTFSAPGLLLITGPLRPSAGEAATPCSARISATGTPRAAETRFRVSPRLDFRLTADFFLGVGVFGASLAGEEPSLGEGNMGAGSVSRGLRPAEARMADSKAFTLGEGGGRGRLVVYKEYIRPLYY